MNKTVSIAALAVITLTGCGASSGGTNATAPATSSVPSVSTTTATASVSASHATTAATPTATMTTPVSTGSATSTSSTSKVTATTSTTPIRPSATSVSTSSFKKQLISANSSIKTLHSVMTSGTIKYDTVYDYSTSTHKRYTVISGSMSDQILQVGNTYYMKQGTKWVKTSVDLVPAAPMDFSTLLEMAPNFMNEVKKTGPNTYQFTVHPDSTTSLVYTMVLDSKMRLVKLSTPGLLVVQDKFDQKVSIPTP